MSLFAYESIHQGLDPLNVLVTNLEENERFMGLAALFADSRINAGGARISIKSSFEEKAFSLCIQQK